MDLVVSGRGGFQSTRPVRGGTYTAYNTLACVGFQSTRPVRGGTMQHPIPSMSSWYFNPPAPCGAGPHIPLCSFSSGQFQSTRPVRGGTFEGAGKMFGSTIFQSTRPVRGGTLPPRCRCGALEISIHPPRAGRDGTSWFPAAMRCKNFNPPAPCGAGQQSCTKFTPCILAQYTIQRAAKLLFAYQ